MLLLSIQNCGEYLSAMWLINSKNIEGPKNKIQTTFSKCMYVHCKYILILAEWNALSLLFPSLAIILLTLTKAKICFTRSNFNISDYNLSCPHFFFVLCRSFWCCWNETYITPIAIKIKSSAKCTNQKEKRQTGQHPL